MSDIVGTPSELERVESTERMSHENAPVDERHAHLSPSIPEEDDPFLIRSDDAGEYHAPPAHLAARFYRDSNNRRKSSATSSRRNSLSSTHSHGSSRSLRRASSCQSSYVAQHLRRASILESRKARLADRAAHAEQVRLRAAVVKAAPRGNASSSEERALAAQIAREKYIAKVAASCAEEVQKAKQKAQEIKARKLAEERKSRQDMEERLADAEKRRAEYQRNLHARRARRASSQEKKLDVVVEDTDADADADAVQEDSMKPALDDETAARQIQRTWRTRRRRRIVETFLDLNITIDSVRQKSFEEVGAFISESTVLSASSKMLELFGLQEDDGSVSGTNVRSFLSAYLIAAHPAFVFTRNGSQEQDLLAKSQELIMLFESAVYRLASLNSFCPSPVQCRELSQLYATYTAAFHAWKAQDSSALVETMVASFVELDAIWQDVKDDNLGSVADDYREGIRDNQVILLSKIRKLAGPDRADFLIKKAIRESRRRRGRKRTAAEVRPRVAETADSESSHAANNPALGESAILTSPPPPSGQPQSDVQSFASLFSPIPNNRIVTHELAVNKDFRVPAAAHSEFRDAFNRKLCDNMREGVERGEDAVWTTAMAQCIRAKLLGTLKPGNSMHNIVSEALDPDHIYKQCDLGMFSYAKFFDFMASILPKLCAPYRDDEVKVLAEDLQSQTDDTPAMIEKLFRLLHFIDLLALDYSNFLLMNAAPLLIRESASYEQKMFAQDLEAGRITLQNTKRCWRNASVNLLTEADRRDPDQVRLTVDRPTPNKIYYRGLVDLAISQKQTSDADWPETLLMDQERLKDTRRNAMFITCIGASLLTAKNLLKRDVRSPWKVQANRLWDLLSKVGLEAEDIEQRAFGILDSATNMPAASKSSLQAACTRFYTQAASGQLTDPVMKILFQRLRSHVFARISASSSQERVRAASTASEGLAGAGLPEFTAHVSDIVNVLGRVSEVDLKSHGVWYEQVSQEVSAAGGQ